MNNEPVAWMHYFKLDNDEDEWICDLNVSGRGIPLYTHPAELTDEEMMKAEYEFMYWNRSLDKPLVEIAYELGVFKQAVAILRKAQEK